jgi:starch phosphorylase
MANTKVIDPRTGSDVESLKLDIEQHLRFTLSKDEYSATDWDHYRSLVLAVMDRLHQRWIDTQQGYYREDVKRVYYLSMEFLIGRLLDSALINLGLLDTAKEALGEIGLDYDKLRNAEWDAGLGNGGLGRLAACFLDSMASLGIPGYGYGIRYDYGIFYQKIINGYQIESPDLWLRYGNPWDVVRPLIAYPVHFYGRSVPYTDGEGHLRYRLEDTEAVLALAYDTPVPGYNNDVVNNLRLWKAESSKAIDLHCFNQGEYIDAIRDTELQENISRVLYPNDKVFVGQELRLKQEFFLVSATLQDIVARFKKKHNDWRKFPDKVAIQCNDTHPNLAIPELMRILLDEEGLDWETSWDIVGKSIAYTNHTLMPEALEKWSVSLMRTLLPRQLEIIYEINNRFLNKVRTNFGEDINRVRRMSIISEGEQPSIQMATLGIVGSHKVNGVSALHSDLLKKTLFHDFYELWNDKFINVTNGITPRRWLKQCNPGLSNLISGKIGDKWITKLDELKQLEKKADDPEFQKQFREIKNENKKKLADYVQERNNIELNLNSIFDIQIKRIHEYKRQLLALLHAVTLFNRIKKDPDAPFQPRTLLFAGKAAPGYSMAKLHIKLINSVAEKINNDPDVGDKLKVVFLANYSVTLAERMIPAAELSEQISTAGMEASGTGNMKFALNGALTIGTLDGANIEIKEEVGDENIFIFGLTVDEIEEMRRTGYDATKFYNENAELKQALDQINSGYFSPNQPDLFQPVVNALLEENDYFMVLADYERYIKKQEEVEKIYQQPDIWWKRAILNTARMGKFSSDRTIMEYTNKIWGARAFTETK